MAGEKTGAKSAPTQGTTYQQKRQTPAQERYFSSDAISVQSDRLQYEIIITELFPEPLSGYLSSQQQLTFSYSIQVVLNSQFFPFRFGGQFYFQGQVISR
ncbi:hypothetical protein EBK54_20995 [Salmonella enterica subsp. enterica]|nr:hypothetical protein [Salmonella enterica]EBV0313665.1 hypothetical protein [Salmonella enterica subsp. enterica serovar Oranienburg]EBZ0799829.1 hypothetical protein [Salmonella enterica subsp. enterica serovar Abony]MLW40847.1 hypothetical protein [Salmonella enterica subsp. enterica serovar Abony]